MNRARLVPLLILVLFAMPVGAFADAPRSPAVPPAKTGTVPASAEAFGDQNTDCAEWGDGCRICRRDDKGTPVCSTPGIACVAGVTACRVKR